MRVTITYQIDELTFPGGAWMATSGEAEITGFVCDTYGDVDHYKIDSISLVGASGLATIDDDHPMFSAVLAGIQGDDESIRSKLEEAAAEDNKFRNYEDDMRAA